MRMEQSNATKDRCPVCRAAGAAEFIAIDDVPVFCNVLWDTRKEALGAAKGEIRLHFCPDCGYVFNGEFDPSRVRYDSGYENSLQYSSVFRTYQIGLVERLVQRYQLYQKDIIEIGCGRGDFLRLLSEKGANRCTGFEPSYDARRLGKNKTGTHFEIIREYYSDNYPEQRADFIACRQVLEHIADPREFMATIRRSMGGNDSAVVFVEVPNAMFTLENYGIWDLIYEHCGYYTMPSLNRLFCETGFNPLRIAESFGGQYLCIEAGPSSGQTESKLPAAPLSIDEVAVFVRGFADMYLKTISYWRKSLQRLQKQGIRTVIWGAGSKGVTFLNVIKTEGIIDHVVDINPHKQGRYVPGTGQQVVSPDALAVIRPQVVITMNPLYTEEIAKIISECNLGKKGNLTIMPVDRIDFRE
jgi:SAM-dependent methyltransferase